jgi:hypothetical protein
MPTAPTSLTVKSSPSFNQPNGNADYPRNLSDLFATGLTFSSGTGANQINRLVIQQFTIAASGTLAIDIDAGTYSGAGSGSLLDLNNEAVTFARLKYLSMRVVDEVSGSTSIKLNGAATHAFLGVAGKAVAAGSGSGFEGPLVWCNPSAAGEVITAATTDILSIVNEDAVHAATVELILGGCAT